MTKKMKKASTNKLTLWYNNDTSYTIPRVENFTVARDGKSVSGCYNKTVSFYGITEEHKVMFTIKLDDVVSMYYDAKHGEVSKNYLVTEGRIDTVTEYRTEDDYYKEDIQLLPIWADRYKKLGLVFPDLQTVPIHSGNV